MDRSHPQVVRFAATLSALDDEALAALANKGLARRARKDVEKAPAKLVSADDDSVSLEVEGCTVRLCAPITTSTCTCSSGVCRHILGAVIFLRESADRAGPSTRQPAEAEPSQAAPSSDMLAEQILAIDESALQKWASKPLLKRAAVVLSRGYEVEDALLLLVRLPGQNVAVRLMGTLPEAMICSCHAPGPCEHKAAAVLAYQAHRSGRAVQLPQATLKASAGAPRSREEVRGAVTTLLREMVALGLCRVSTVTQQRLRTLATSAHGVDLPRLQRMLKALSDEVSLTLARDARASAPSLLLSAARTAALCAALEHPTPRLVGEHRSLYMPVTGTLDLVGLGAGRWRTRSGYHGLTVYFWEPASRCWTAWTDARPIGTPGFDPAARFDEDGPWPGCGNPRQAARTSWRLSGANRNGTGRIAARVATRGIVRGRSGPGEGPLLADFAQLAERAKQAFASGLGDRPGHADLVLLAPVHWSEAGYDPVTQEVTRLVADANHRIPLVLRHAPETDQGLTSLQRIDGSTVRAVLGSLKIGARGLFVEPITLWTETQPIHLTLDADTSRPARRATKEGAPRPVEDDAGEVDEEEADSGEAVPSASSRVARLLAQAESELLAIAEGGVEVARDLSPLRLVTKDCAALGLATCAAGLTKLCDELERFRKSLRRDATAAAAQLLRTSYLVHLAAECASLTGALASEG